MANATSISLSKFTGTVQAAVKSALQKHPKFQVEPPQAVTVAYLIRGFPVPEAILASATVAETQAFANDVAGHIAGAHPEVFGTGSRATAEGAVLSVGRFVIVGIPPVQQVLQLEK